jgi:hypothetical protein
MTTITKTIGIRMTIGITIGMTITIRNIII